MLQKVFIKDIPALMMIGQHSQIYQNMSEELQSIVTFDQFKSMSDEYIQGIISFQVDLKSNFDGNTIMNWIDDSGLKGIQAAMDGPGTIVGLLLCPLERFPETDQQQTETTFKLLFRGEWFVFWGGHHVMNNYHYEHESQRYAVDLVQMKDGYTHQGHLMYNESYYAFGQDIIAAAEGKVFMSENDIADNTPVGVTNEDQPMGNYVIIDHGNSEYSIYAHLKQGSVIVKAGDQVSQGDLIGLCGNSGNSTEAHLHFQVSDNPDLFEDGSMSLNIKWEQEAAVIRGNTLDGGK